MHLPPLIDPGPPLSGAESARTARHTLLPEIGEIGQRRLAAARVLVIGAGGLGAPVLAYLAAAGVGTIGIVDDDVVDLSNLHRQVIHSHDAIGQPKVDSAAQRLVELAPDLTVIRHPIRLTAENIAGVLEGYHLVLDGTDTFATRYLVSDACAAAGLPLVWGSVLQFDAQVSVFWTAPPAGFPALTLRDLFPAPPAPGSVPSCAEAGVLGSLCGIVGSIMATEAVKLIVGSGDVLLGRVAVIDALRMRVHEVPFASNDGGASSEGAPASRTQGVGSAPAPGASSGAAAPAPADASGPTALAGAALSRTQAEATGTSATAAPTAVPTLTLAQFAAWRSARLPAALMDVREPSEFALDALPGAVNVPLSALEQTARLGGDALEEWLEDQGIDAARLAVYCAAGKRATRAVRALIPLGWKAAVLPPGVVDEIREAQRSIEPLGGRP